MPRGVKATPPVDKETLDKWVEFALDKFYRGTSSDNIHKELMHNFNMPYDKYTIVKAEMKKRIVKATELYEANAKKINIERLQMLLQDAVGNNDGKLALDIVKELNKLAGLYVEKVQVENVEYQLEL